MKKIRRFFKISFAVLIAACWLSQVAVSKPIATGPSRDSQSVRQPAIGSLLKPEIYQRVMKDRDIATYASLKKIDGVPDLKNYSFYAAMLTRADVNRTRQVLTDYQLYSKLIPYVNEAKYQPATHLLELKGGIWKWKLHSLLRFEERGDRWIHYQIIGGHFTGMTGDLFFEPAEPGTLVYMRGSQPGSSWPPAFILEQGAQIVFEFTAKRMRSYLESAQDNTQAAIRSGRSQNDQIPQPRSHL